MKKYKKIYVVCPAYSKSGGPELLHQLVSELKVNNIDAYIVYYGIRKDSTNNIVAEDFKKYYTNICDIENIEDNHENLIIMPEVYTHLFKRWKKIDKSIWWMSVDNYTKFTGLKGIRYNIKQKGILRTIKYWLITKNVHLGNERIKKVKYHFCQSYYAIDFLKKLGITKGVIYLSDYINSTYLDVKIESKEDIVLYNPKKGIEFTKKLIEMEPELKWIAIENLTTQQVKELLLKSKVYIDFGNHPGKDRFPREAAMCGCCIITGKRGSAAYNKDVPILEEFKFEDDSSKVNLRKIMNKIKECLRNYDIEKEKFYSYKEFIQNEEIQFKNDVRHIFVERDEIDV